MAIPIKFDGCNCTLAPPATIVGLKPSAGHTDAYSDGKQVVTCWRLSSAELLEVAQTGLIWLIVAGQNQPRICVSGQGVLSAKGLPATADDESVKPALN